MLTCSRLCKENFCVKLCSDLLQALQREPLTVMGSLSDVPSSFLNSGGLKLLFFFISRQCALFEKNWWQKRCMNESFEWMFVKTVVMSSSHSLICPTWLTGCLKPAIYLLLQLELSSFCIRWALCATLCLWVFELCTCFQGLLTPAELWLQGLIADMGTVLDTVV